MSDFAATPGRAATRASRLATAGWLLAALFCAAFGIMAAWFPVAVRAGTHDIWLAIQGAFTSADYSFGPHSSVAKHALYRRALGGLGLHTIAGGAALLAATTQFIPLIRRRWPLVHRAAGASVVVLVAVSMVGSLIVLASHPLAATLSGAGFGIGLASLSGLALTELALAVLAIRARDYRSHMGWMALMFASLLTAPVLRLQWLLFGASGLPLDAANLVVAVYLVPQTILIMAVWMQSVGARDLGLAATQSLLPPAVLRGLAAATVVVVVHEGCLAPFGLDLLHAWRVTGPVLPKAAAIWSLAAAGLAWRAPRDLQRLGDGAHARFATTCLAFAAACGGIIVALTLDGRDLQALALRSFFAASSVEIALLAFLGRRAALGHFATWDAQWLSLALAPALWPLLAASYVPLHVGAFVAMPTAMSIAYASLAMIGFASAFGLRVRLPKRQNVALPGIAPAV